MKPVMEHTKRGDEEHQAHVDHVEAHNGNWEKFTDISNLETLCFRCHSVKTATSDKGFGN
jgi:5-methylcytosine-specific restriction endonuclease McrA